MPEIPEIVDGSYPPGRRLSRETLTWSRLRSISGERAGRAGPELTEGTLLVPERSECSCSGVMRAMGITFVPPVPAVWMELVSSKGLPSREKT